MQRWLCLLLCVSLLGCSTTSITHSTNSLTFKNGVFPERQIRLVVLLPDVRHKAHIERVVADGSAALLRQTGISLAVADWRPIEWQSHDRGEMLNQVASTMASYPRQYDMAVAFQSFSPPELLQYVLIGNWEGVIDDTYRRFIIIRRMTSQVLLHEICHAFLFSGTHSWGLRNLMTPVTLYVLPGIMPLNRSNHLYEKDRVEIIQNKWRDFSILPLPHAMHSRDRVSVSAVQE